MYANDGSVLSSSTISNAVVTISIENTISSLKLYTLALGTVSICEIYINGSTYFKQNLISLNQPLINVMPLQNMNGIIQNAVYATDGFINLNNSTLCAFSSTYAVTLSLENMSAVQFVEV